MKTFLDILLVYYYKGFNGLQTDTLPIKISNFSYILLFFLHNSRHGMVILYILTALFESITYVFSKITPGRYYPILPGSQYFQIIINKPK